MRKHLFIITCIEKHYTGPLMVNIKWIHYTTYSWWNLKTAVSNRCDGQLISLAPTDDETQDSEAASVVGVVRETWSCQS